MNQSNPHREVWANTHDPGPFKEGPNPILLSLSAHSWNLIFRLVKTVRGSVGLSKCSTKQHDSKQKLESMEEIQSRSQSQRRKIPSGDGHYLDILIALTNVVVTHSREWILHSKFGSDVKTNDVTRSRRKVWKGLLLTQWGLLGRARWTLDSAKNDLWDGGLETSSEVSIVVTGWGSGERIPTQAEICMV